MPRKLSHFAAAQPWHLARGCAQGISSCNATSGDGLRVQRRSTDGTGPGISSGEQQPPAGKMAMEELSQVSASSFQKTQSSKFTGSPEYFPAQIFLQQACQGTVPAKEPLLSAYSTAAALVCREGLKEGLKGWLPGEQKVLSAAEPALVRTWSKAMRAHCSTC